MSDVFFENFPSTVAKSSTTTSCDDSFDNRLKIIGSVFPKSSSVFGAGVLVTPGHLPLSSIPSSINSFRFRNIVSGISDHNPRFDMCNSPERCESAISLGREFVSKYSARVFFPLVNRISSTPFRIFSTFVSIS